MNEWNEQTRQTCREALEHQRADVAQYLSWPQVKAVEKIAAIDAALAELDTPPQPVLVEVQPPAHVLDMLLMEMEGDYCLDTLRFVIYNDAERDEWLRPQPPIPADVREAVGICANYGMPLGITSAEYNAARDKVRAWLDANSTQEGTP